MLIKKIALIAMLTPLLGASPLDTDVLSYSVNVNLSKTLKTHEEIMIKLIKDMSLMREEIKILQVDATQKQAKINELSGNYKELQENTSTKTVTTIKKYDTEFKKYLQSNR